MAAAVIDPMKLRTAFWNYDRTTPLMDGRVTLDDVELDIQILTPDQTFSRAYQGDGFDVCEASFSNSVTAHSKGACPYVLIPAFLSRAFRHSAIFIRTDRGIDRPEDLAGKRIGLQEYDMTAAVVVRGLLRDRYGLDPADIRWRVGDGPDTKPTSFPKGGPPDDVSIEPLPDGKPLAAALLDGDIDAAIMLRVPPAVRDSALVHRLFPNPAEAERDWYLADGIFPIMHAVGVRRDLAAAHPGLTRKLYEAFAAAKAMALADLDIIQVPKVTMPWPHVALAEARHLMGDDPWPYGIARNRHVLETQLRWSRQDGLQAKPMALEDLFAPDCLDT
jgi:4,5-dihydroxyphthalate decarboxylase